MKSPLIFFFFFLLVLTPVVLSQVVQTQVIELTSKVRDFFIEATKGNIVGQETFNMNGHNEDLGTTEEDVQEQGGILVFLQAAEIMSITSTSADDTIAGINATTVFIKGLDENFTEISETVNLSGTTSVNTTQEFIRINDFKVDSVGSYGSANQGDIDISGFFDGTIQSFIESTEGVSHTTHYTVPKGKEIIIVTISASVETGKTVEMHLHFRENADDIIAPMSPVNILKDLHGIAGAVTIDVKGNLKFSEMTDVWFSASTSTGPSSDLEVNYDFLQYAIGT